ncbi:MAG: glycosyltransferase family 4 protein [Pyrinomonadaceae bacterium]
MNLGIIANEFFSLEAGGRGGFGWAALQVSHLFNSRPEYGVDVLFLSRRFDLGKGAAPMQIHHTPLMGREGPRLTSLRKLRAKKLDLLMMIDYRSSYRFFAAALPRTPIIVWARDPRSPEDVQKINTLRIPGGESLMPPGISEVDCTSLRSIVRMSRLLRRPIRFATPAPNLAVKVPGTYNVNPSVISFLPNIIDVNPDKIAKSAQPRVIFLGRLDPIKRPWLFAKLAEQFPEVEFCFMGHSHFAGPGTWQPVALPPNVRLLGHVEGIEKLKLLASAWALVNTSIHEGLPVSFLEALACETPIISCQNPAELVSRFGVYVGRWDGDGLNALPHFAEALARLLSDQAARAKLGKEGRAWVNHMHSPARFLESFRELCVSVGIVTPKDWSEIPMRIAFKENELQLIRDDRS